MGDWPTGSGERRRSLCLPESVSMEPLILVCKEFGSLSQNKCVTVWILVDKSLVFSLSVLS